MLTEGVMVATTMHSTSVESQDALAYLPRTRPVEYRHNQIIYDRQQPAPGLFLILQGRVKVSTMEDGSETVIHILGPEAFFGESTLLGEHTAHREQATALETTTVMMWTTDQIETRIA